MSKAVHINGIAYQYEVGSGNLSVRNMDTRKRVHYNIETVRTACGCGSDVIMPSHVRYWLMSQMGIDQGFRLNAGDLVILSPVYRSTTLNYLVVGRSANEYKMFRLDSQMIEDWHECSLIARQQYLTIIPGS